MIDGFMLLVGHLIGDYVVQNDWQAANKTNPAPSFKSYDEHLADGGQTRRKWWVGHLACTVHCMLYTLAVWACSFWWMPWWGVVACFVIHWPVDRFGLAKKWMMNVSGQKKFATGALSPWSIIVVDNTFHLLTLGVIAKLAEVIK